MSRASKHSARARERQRRAKARATKKAEARSTRRLVTHRGIVFMLILFGLLFSSVYPMKRYFAVRTSIASLQQEERRLDRRAAELATEKQRLQGDEAVEQLAREQLGMVKVGEVPFVTIEPGASTKPVARPPVVEDRADPPPPSIWSRMWSTLKRSTRALR